MECLFQDFGDTKGIHWKYILTFVKKAVMSILLLMGMEFECGENDIIFEKKE